MLEKIKFKNLKILDLNNNKISDSNILKKFDLKGKVKIIIGKNEFANKKISLKKISSKPSFNKSINSTNNKEINKNIIPYLCKTYNNFNNIQFLGENYIPKQLTNRSTIKGRKGIYYLTEIIKTYPFGELKLAFNANDQKIKYVCKILEKSKMKGNKDFKRHIKDTNILNKMNHQHIMTIIEIISSSNKYFIIMEYCSKGRLIDNILKETRFDDEKCSLFFYQLLSGVEYIHSAKLCHMNLNCENILINSKEELKITDFKSSYYKSEENKYLPKIDYSHPEFSPPELILGNKIDGFSYDIWNLGIILYTMLCGNPPFKKGKKDIEIELLFENIVERKIEYPEEIIGKIARNLLQKIFVENPKARVTIGEIKEHRFFLMGRDIYLKRFILKNVKSFVNLKNNFNKRNFHLEDIDSYQNNDNITTYTFRKKNERINKINKKIDTYSNNVSLEGSKGDGYSPTFTRARCLISEEKNNVRAKIYKKGSSSSNMNFSLNNFPSLKKIYFNNAPLKYNY